MELKYLVMRRSRVQHSNNVHSSNNNTRFTLFGLSLALLLVTTNVHQSDGYGGGAPTSDAICSSMVPAGHGVPAQTSPMPFKIMLDKREVKGGDTVEVTLATLTPNGAPFKGFFVMGRKEDYLKEKKPQGKFTSEIKANPNDPTLAQITTCNQVSDSSTTHTNGNGKKQVKLKWQAPNVDGKYVLAASFVQDFTTFWVEHPSEVITVKRSADFQEATTTATPRATPSPDLQKQLQPLYDGCGDTSHDIPKGCFGLPSGCVGNKDCELLVTFRKDGENGVRFELMGRDEFPGSNSYVAVGISKDTSMGDDSVFGCRRDGNRVSVNEYYNKGKVNGASGRTGSIIKNAEGRDTDGYLVCSFNVKPPSNLIIDVQGSKFDLENDRFNLLLARGSNSAGDYLGKHPKVTDRDVAPQAVRLTEVVNLKSKSPILVELHGAFMIMAWLLCASSGMFTARYYKQTHTNSKPCGVAFWFALHRFCMFLTILLSLTASVLIFVENSWEYTPNPNDEVAEKFHPILGIILTCLAVLQVLIAFCRPMPTARNRWAFNWFHWTVGNTAHIVGIACIFLANDLGKSNLQGQSRYWGVLTGFVVFHVILHILMSFHTLKADRQMEIQNKKRAVLPGPMKLSGLDAEAPGTGFRTAILTIYIIGAAVTASLLVYFVVDSLEN